MTNRNENQGFRVVLPPSSAPSPRESVCRLPPEQVGSHVRVSGHGPPRW